MIQGSPITAKLPEDLHVGDRFWHWRGVSDRNYIHSIYPADACPPLPGAVYVLVRGQGDSRRALAVGRFPSFWDSAMTSAMTSAIAEFDGDEIHVHLLARNDKAAEAILNDLRDAMPKPSNYLAGFHEPAPLALCAA